MFAPLTNRSCSICHRELTDAASVETGVGPVCRSRSNEALAKSFPANFDEAFALVCTARDKGLLVTVPEAQATLTAIADAVIMDADARSLTALGNILLKFAASKHFLNILLLSTLAKSGCLKSTFRSC